MKTYRIVEAKTEDGYRVVEPGEPVAYCVQWRNQAHWAWAHAPLNYSTTYYPRLEFATKAEAREWIEEDRLASSPFFEPSTTWPYCIALGVLLGCVAVAIAFAIEHA